LDANGRQVLDEDGRPMLNDSWRRLPPADDRNLSADELRRAGWRNLNELIRWRLFQRTGGGLMAELGSHQLDACSIFLRKQRPPAVTGVGGKFFYTDDREVEDHVFCTFEFPGKRYDRSRRRYENGVPVGNDVVGVTYSSISTNAFEDWGEWIMGTK